MDDFEVQDLTLTFRNHTLKIRVAQDPLSLVGKTKPNGAPIEEVYWGVIWTAGIALANALLENQVEIPVGPNPILELGCGTGLVSVAAALAGSNQTFLLATDIEPWALQLTRQSALQNGVATRISTQHLDWNAPYRGSHQLILAADCLYEPKACTQLARFVRTHLSDEPNARALIADPTRLTSKPFRQTALDEGLNVALTKLKVPFQASPWPSLSPAQEDLLSGNDENRISEVDLYTLTKKIQPFFKTTKPHS